MFTILDRTLLEQEYTIKVQSTGSKDGAEEFTDVGKVTIDLAKFVGDATNTQSENLPVQFKVGGGSNGMIRIVVTTTHLGEMSEDGMTEVSGMTGMTSEGGGYPDQDLEGVCVGGAG
jgi:hypothetical protein